MTIQRPVLRSRDQYWPIRGQVTWHVLTNQRPVFRDSTGLAYREYNQSSWLQEVRAAWIKQDLSFHAHMDFRGCKADYWLCLKAISNDQSEASIQVMWPIRGQYSDNVIWSKRILVPIPTLSSSIEKRGNPYCVSKNSKSENEKKSNIWTKSTIVQSWIRRFEPKVWP